MLNKEQQINIANAVIYGGVSAAKAGADNGVPARTAQDFIARNTFKDTFWVDWDVGVHKKSASKAEGPVIRSFDIECTPLEVYSWSMFKPMIPLNMLKKDWYLLSYAAKTLGEDDAEVFGLCDMQGYQKEEDGEEELVGRLWDLFDSSDILVGHNAKSFDVKKVQSKFIKYGYGRPSQFQVVDTLNIVKANFSAPSNKLDYWLKYLEFKGKMEHEGFEMWKGCMNGDGNHWDNMKMYNLQDTTELEGIYLAVRGWHSKHPNWNNYTSDGVLRCSVCGNEHLNMLDSNATTALSTFDQYRCGECGNIGRGSKNLKTKEQMQNTLRNVISG